MRFISNRRIEIFTDGTSSFSSGPSKIGKQIIFYAKDAISLLFYKKPKKSQQTKTASRTSYKSKYKF